MTNPLFTKTRLKYLVKSKLKYGLNEPAIDDNPTHPRYIRITDFGNDGKLIDETFKSMSPEVAEGYYLTKGDLLFARSGATVGKTFQYNGPDNSACFAGYLIKATANNKKILPKYLMYFTQSSEYENWKNSIFSQSTIQNIGADKYAILPITHPIDIHEQENIIFFLDKKCEQIDKAIAKKLELISSLEKAKQIFISHSINQNSEKRTRLKYLITGKLKYGLNEPAIEENTQHPRYIRITDFGNDGKLIPDTFKSMSPEKAEGYYLSHGDLLFARSGATVGKTFQYEGEDNSACFAGYLIKATPNPKKISPKLLMYFTQSADYENWKNSIFSQSTIQNIGADKYCNLFVNHPEDIKKQEKIINLIEVKNSKVDNAISKTQKEIDLLSEYKLTLISEAVTGKIDLSKMK